MSQFNNSAAFLKYQRHLDAKGGGRRREPRPHWWRLLAIRRHQPQARPDQLAELWAEWLAAHGGDRYAALGALVADHIDSKGRV